MSCPGISVDLRPGERFEQSRSCSTESTGLAHVMWGNRVLTSAASEENVGGLQKHLKAQATSHPLNQSLELGYRLGLFLGPL